MFTDSMRCLVSHKFYHTCLDSSWTLKPRYVGSHLGSSASLSLCMVLCLAVYTPLASFLAGNRSRLEQGGNQLRMRPDLRWPRRHTDPASLAAIANIPIIAIHSACLRKYIYSHPYTSEYLCYIINALITSLCE
jgi:hypothetical protein